MNKKPTLLLVTNLFPNSQEATRGIFTKQLMDHIKEWYEIVTVSPTPWLPPFLAKLLNRPDPLPYKENIDNYDIYHPGYLVTPKIGRSLYGFFFFFGIFLTLKNLKKKHNPTIINAHWAYPDGFGTLLAAKLLKLPIAIHVLGCDVNEYSKYFWRRNFIRFSLSRADKVIVVSQALKERCAEIGVPVEKIDVVHNGVDQNKFRYQDKTECRNQLGLPTDKKIILYAGNFNIEKGLHHLLEAYAKIEAEHLDTVLCVVGSGPMEVKISQQIKDLGIADRLIMKGRIPHEEMPTFLCAADFLCLPSLREGCPNIVLESLASGTAVIASRVGAVPDMLNSQDIPLGIMAEPSNPNDLSKAINNALNKEWPIKDSFKWMTWRDDAEACVNLFKSIER